MSVGSSVINKEQSAPTRHLRPRTQPISCRDTLFMTIFEGTLSCGELQGEYRRHAVSEIHRCSRTCSHFRPRQLPESDDSVSHFVGSRELVSAKAVGFL